MVQATYIIAIINFIWKFTDNFYDENSLRSSKKESFRTNAMIFLILNKVIEKQKNIAKFYMIKP